MTHFLRPTATMERSADVYRESWSYLAVMEDAAGRLSIRSITPWEARVARVSNGPVRVGDWVAELPASHFQPCACCLCRPPAGARPVFRIRAIESDGGRTYLRFGREHRYAADEFERVELPGNAIDPVVIASDPGANAGLLRYHLSRPSLSSLLDRGASTELIISVLLV